MTQNLYKREEDYNNAVKSKNLYYAKLQKKYFHGN